MFSLSYTKFFLPHFLVERVHWRTNLCQNPLASPADDEACQYYLEASIVCVAGWQKEKRQDGSLHVKQRP